MCSSPKLYKVIKKGRETTSLLPGKFAGNKTHKIFGRLDCKTGMRLMKKENRVFFLTWEDAVAAGYRPCKNCKPDPDDRYRQHRKLEETLEAQPHIALWKSRPPPNRRRPKIAWYACLNWTESDKTSCQVTLSDSFAYQRARSVAIALGKKYNLPVLQQSAAYFTILWEPIQRPNDIVAAQDRKALKELQASKDAIKFESMF